MGEEVFPQSVCGAGQRSQDVTEAAPLEMVLCSGCFVLSMNKITKYLPGCSLAGWTGTAGTQLFVYKQLKSNFYITWPI